MYGVVFREPVRKEVGQSDTRASLGAAAGPPARRAVANQLAAELPNPCLHQMSSPTAKGGEAVSTAIGRSCIDLRLQLQTRPDDE
jgi:hypothetical protein